MSVASSGARRAHHPHPDTSMYGCFQTAHELLDGARYGTSFVPHSVPAVPIGIHRTLIALENWAPPHCSHIPWACTPVNSELYFFSTSARSRSSPPPSPGAHRHMDTYLLGLVLPTHLLSLYDVCCCSLSRDRNGGSGRCLSIATIMKFRNRRDVDEMKCI